MAQPHAQAPARTFSPTSQMTPSPGSHPAPPFPVPPPSKKPRLSPAPSPQGLSQPGSVFSPRATSAGLNGHGSPATPGTPNSMASPTSMPVVPPSGLAASFPLPTTMPSAAASPIATPTAFPAPTHSASFPNGATPSIPLPVVSPAAAGQVFSPRPAQTPTPPTPTGPLTPSGPPLPHLAPAPSQQLAGGAPSVFVPLATSSAVQTPTGMMGPPLKPAERPTKEYQYDVDDSLAGTGIDLRQEEQFQADYFAGSFRPEARTGFPANTPGRRGSFYGALAANQPAQHVPDGQDKAALGVAKSQWEESARALATARNNALRNPFLELNGLHARADRIAREYGVGVILDPKPNAASSVKLRQDSDFPRPRVTVKTQVGPDGVAFVASTGTFLPEDTYLADQLALLSLATKHRLRELLEDANKVAVSRQQTAHGIVPDEWVDAAAPLPVGGSASSAVPGDDDEGGAHANPLKRPLETDDAAAAEAVKKIATVNTLAQSLRAVGRTERDWEEKRLLKRQKREGKKTDGSPATATPRSGTPGPSGAVAPEPEKAPTKKELKKSAAAKVAEQNDTLSANRTSMAFLGGRKKQYSWMSGGSGASTPKRGMSMGGGLGGLGGLGGGGGGGGGGGSNGGSGSGSGGGAAAGGSGGGAGGRRPGESMMLTGDGRTRLGTWREEGPKGKDIQLRDWVIVLEADSRETAALQQAYNKLDGLPPRPAV